MEDLAALVAENEEAAAAIAAAYEVLLGGVPNVAGFTFLIENIVATNYGSNNPDVVFNQENAFINVANALVQGNPAALASFQAITAGAASLSDKVAAIYNAMVPTGSQSAEGLAYLTRPDALAFYEQVAAERGVGGPDAAAIVALASILNITYTNDTPGIGDAVNDLLAAIADGSAQLPLTGDTLTPIEVADGPNFDGDDFGAATILTINPDTFIGSATNDIIKAPVVQTAFLPTQTLNAGDSIDGGGGRNTLEAQLSDFLVQPVKLANIQHISLEASPLALGLAVGPRIVDALYADAIDEVSFRAPNLGIALPISGLGLTNVSTVVNTVNVKDSGNTLFGGVNHFITFIGDALDGDADAVRVNLTNVVDSSLTLSGAYELATINSVGPVANSFTLAIATLEELTIIGDADLELGELEIDPLVLVDASAFTGDLDATFRNNIDAGLDGVNDVIEVIGGSGDDTLGFIGSRDSDVTVSGGAGDDHVDFFLDSNGDVTFTATDSIDGGDGDEDILGIEAEGGALLLAGVGSNITGVEIIEHFGDLNTDLTVDWSRSGSAAVLLLDADYDNLDVTVTNLTNDDKVVYAGEWLDTLTLSNANPIGLSDEVNLELDTGINVGALLDLDVLVIPTTTELLNLETSGVGFAEIDNASLIETDVIVTGVADLALGTSWAGAYDFATGAIDAEVFEGDLAVATGDGSQTVVAGLGDDVIQLGRNLGYGANAADNHDIVDLSAGGSDLVAFQAYTESAALAATSANYHFVQGFDVADDLVGLNAGTAPTVELGGDDLLPADDALVMNYQAGTIIDGTLASLAGVNFIKFTTAAVGANLSVNAIFDQAFGLGEIQIGAGFAQGESILASAYDATAGVMVLFELANAPVAFSPLDVLDANDDVDVLGVIQMTQAEYSAFNASNIDFVADFV